REGVAGPSSPIERRELDPSYEELGWCAVLVRIEAEDVDSRIRGRAAFPSQVRRSLLDGHDGAVRHVDDDLVHHVGPRAAVHDDVGPDALAGRVIARDAPDQVADPAGGRAG